MMLYYIFTTYYMRNSKILNILLGILYNYYYYLKILYFYLKKQKLS